MEVQTGTQAGIQLTENAVKQIQKLREMQNQPDAALRFGAVGGGCSGLSYKLGLEPSEPKETDEILEVSGIKILVDKRSLPFVGGTTIDYSHDLLNGGFKFLNPNAKGECGCGVSFSV